MFSLKLISVKSYKKLLIEVYGKGYTDGQDFIINSKTADRRCFILGRPRFDKVDREINDICEREGL